MVSNEGPTLGRKPIAVELRRSERAAAMFTKGEIERIEAWIAKQSLPATLSDAVRALALKGLDSE
jgi:hypothetical protein